MEIDKEKFKESITEYIHSLRLLETELLAYRFAIHLATEGGLSDPNIPWKEMVAAAKENPATLQLMAAKYDPLLQELLMSVDLADAQERVLELLRKWQPSGSPN